MEASISPRVKCGSPLLRLPAELRLQIYEHVIGSRTVHVRMHWTGKCPSGFKYSCLEETKHLLESHDTKIVANAVPFGPDLHGLVHTCRQVHKETVCLPFKAYTWAFKNAFTLEQWVSMKGCIPTQYKNALRRIAVPAPGPYRSSERVLVDLREVLLVGSGSPVSGDFTSEPRLGISPLVIITLKKDKASNAWIWGGEPAQYVKDHFEQAASSFAKSFFSSKSHACAS